MHETAGGPARHWAVWKGVAVALATIMVLGFLLGLVLYLTPLPELYLDSYALAVLTVGIFLGAFSAARYARCRGLLHGVLVAALVLLVMVVLTWLGPWEFCLSLLVRFLIAGLIAGVLGGIVGVSWR